MNPKRRWVIGTAADCDLVVPDSTVSPHHCCLIRTPRGYVLEDLGSTTGTYVNGCRIAFRARITPADRVTLGPTVRMPWPAAGTLPANVFRVGRAPDNDLVLDYPVISPYHARIVMTAQETWIEDLNSPHGTALGRPEQKITRAPLTPRDVVYFGWFPFPAARLLSQLRERQMRRLALSAPPDPVPGNGQITVTAKNLAVEAAGRCLLQDVSLTVWPGELVGILGPSGAGKTTLLKALNGYTVPAAGAVLYNGKDLQAHYRQFSGHLGYVPQDDILHHELSVRQVLAYGARLRLPRARGGGPLAQRVHEVVQQLGLAGTEDVVIGPAGQRGISGGQRKRVNLALELLTDPLVLFLDEPTSGLSSEEAVAVMRLLRDLADRGKTIVLTIHQPSREVFRLLDNLVVLSRDANSTRAGRLVYYGPADPDALQFFARPERQTAPDAILRELAAYGTEEGVRRYTASRYSREFVTERLRALYGARVPPLIRGGQGIGSGLSQWWALVRRGLAIKLRNPLQTGILLMQAPAIAALIVLVYGKQTSATVTVQSWPDVSGSVAVTLFLMILAALWFGCSNAVREIVGEWAVYQRERMVSLRLPAYLAAKLTILGSLCVVQGAVLLGIVHKGCSLKGPWLPLAGFLLLAALVGVALGLVVSALARSSAAAVSLLPVLLLLMVILGGAMQPPYRMNELTQLACQAVPSRWAFEGMLLLESEQQPVLQPVVAANPAYPGAPAQAMQVQDMAEHYFPRDGHRTGITVAALALGTTLLVLVVGLYVILRLRDIY
jgi:ABC-type multidrug transport system ATPase subunit/pSer/pThr/pTyr-binding forkhead associated (FHA) protein